MNGLSQKSLDRVYRNFHRSDGCWNWCGPKTKSGYGTFAARVGGKVTGFTAHRLVYELIVGPIPSGMTLDHLCKNTSCVNPDHLEPVSQAENSRRGDSWEWQKRKTHCPRGHEYNDQNTYVYASGARKCKACRRDQMRLARS